MLGRSSCTGTAATTKREREREREGERERERERGGGRQGSREKQRHKTKKKTGKKDAVTGKPLLVHAMHPDFAIINASYNRSTRVPQHVHTRVNVYTRVRTGIAILESTCTLKHVLRVHVYYTCSTGGRTRVF